MEVKKFNLTIKQLVEQYSDNGEGGVKGYGGDLDIRPPYQREFVYKDKQRDAVINTVFEGFPLNVMYWAKIGENQYEVIDGQQRTISICQYHKGDFSFNERYFHNLQDDEQKWFLNYELDIYICDGEPSEKLKWFEIINIAGEKLEKQELLNAIYHGSWVADAKRYFSRSNCPAYRVFSKYLNGSFNRQDYLETAIKWIVDSQEPKRTIEGYMSIHQNDENAVPLWAYFRRVANWVEATFTNYRREMKGIHWGILYNRYGGNHYDADEIEENVKKLMQDDEVQTKKGIYDYVFTKDEKSLKLRVFSPTQKRKNTKSNMDDVFILSVDFLIKNLNLKKWTKITSFLGEMAVRQR